MDSENLPVEWDREAKRRVLQALGGDERAVEEVLSHGAPPFSWKALPSVLAFPLPDEGHVSDWRGYAAEQRGDPFGFLQECFPQLRIPVQAGVSKTSAYAEAVRRGNPASHPLSGGPRLVHPEGFRMMVHEHPAGALPVIVTSSREDFEMLVHVLACRNEPVPVHPSLNGQFISGLINWQRVRRYERQWRRDHAPAGDLEWGREMARVSQVEKWRFYDRLVLLGVSPYSRVPARALGLDWDEARWQERSMALRLEHEFTHYTLLRLFGRTEQGLHDEIISDWAGITSAMGDFKASWLLTFLGLGQWPTIAEEGRLHVYSGSLSSDGLRLLGALLVEAALGLEALHRDHYDPSKRQIFLLALTQLCLETLAGKERRRTFSRALKKAERRLRMDRSR